MKTTRAPRRRSICFSKATGGQTAFLISTSVFRKSYRKRMVQKTFTMWPRINSSTASTVSFLTDEDNRFILFFLLAFYSDTLPHWRVKRNLRPCDRQCGNSSTLRLLKLEPAWRGLCRTHTSSTKRKDVFMARRLLATALPVSGRTSSPKGGTAFARIRALGRHLFRVRSSYFKNPFRRLRLARLLA